MRRSVAILFGYTSILAMTLSGQCLWACSRVFPTYKVPGDFVAAVKGVNDKPLEGIEVTIDRSVEKPKFKIEKVAVAVADKDGLATFHGLAPGKYFIGAERAHISGGSGELLVVNDSSGSARIRLTWPDAPIIKIRKLAGKLAIGRDFAAFTNADLSLTETFPVKLVGTTATDENGGFAFPDVGPGLYVMHVEERRQCDSYMCKIQGNIVVEVDPKAKDREFPRYGLTPSSCGLAAYKDDGSIEIFE